MLGFGKLPGIDLGFLGMPTCSLYAGLDIILGFATPGPSASLPWTVPVGPGMSGLLVMAQTATLTPGINAFGMATSNGLQLLLGVN